MDNSLRNHDTTDGTIYLSFDSTLSSNVALNNANEISATEEDILEDKCDESNFSSKTLEAETTENGSLLCMEKCVTTLKKLNVNAQNHPSPLRQFSNNIIKQFQPISSTPSKDQHNMMGFERSSEISVVCGLKMGYLEAEGEKSCASIQANYKENKENILMQDNETDVSASTSGAYSLSSDIEYTQLHEKKLTPHKQKDTKTSPKKINSKEVPFQRDFDLTISTEVVKSESKPSGMADKLTISDDNSSNLSGLKKQIMNNENGGNAAKINKPEKRMAFLNYRGRSSLLPIPENEKRAYNLSKRMSIIVKTTLNSPARKMVRKSIINNQTRRSMIPSNNVNMPNSRKSMVPLTKAKPVPDVSTMLTNNTKPKIVTRKTLYQPKSEIANINVKNGKDNVVPNTKTKVVTSTATYSCNFCSCTFRVKSLLDAHKRSHEESPALVKKQVAAGAISKVNTNNNRCKYCDKKFVLERTLHIHLMQNCNKIPPSEKRKLEFTELNHVEKAHLPTFCHGNSSIASTNLSVTTAKKPMENVVKKLVSIANNVSQNSGDSYCDVTEAKATTNLKMQPPQTKLRKNAHIGIYRTPNKSVPCHICKQTFLSVLDYTNHNKKMHPTHQFSNTKQYNNESSLNTTDKSS